MKPRKRANQMQVMLFDELGPNDGPSPVEMPADRSLELEKAIAELLFKAAGKVERAGGRGGDRDA
jgi:hypothetical protein